MATRRAGTGKRESDGDFDDLDDTLVDDEPDDGFELLDDENVAAPEDRRRDPLRRPV